MKEMLPEPLLTRRSEMTPEVVPNDPNQRGESLNE